MMTAESIRALPIPVSIPVSIPGEDWSAILARPGPGFASAFTRDVVLDTSVGSAPIVGPENVRRFFEATSAMYARFEVVSETHGDNRTFLEWEGRFAGRDIGGVTILTRDRSGAIANIQLYHRSFDQVITFSTEPARRIGRAIQPSPFAS